MLKQIVSSAIVLACVACQSQHDVQPMAVAATPMLDVAQPNEAVPATSVHQAIKNELQLSEAQDVRMQAAHADFQAKAAAIRADQTLSLDQRKTALRAAEKDHETTVSSILTPEQRVKHDAFLEKKKSIRQDRAATRQQLKKEYNVSAAQEKQLKQVRSETYRKKQRIVSNTALTEAQKTEQLKTLATEHQAKIKKIFTKEQWAKMQAAQANPAVQ